MNKCVHLLLFFNLFLGLIYTFASLTGTTHTSIYQLIDLNGEANIPTWYSSIQLFTIALFFLFFYIQEKKKSLLIISIVFLVMSCEEGAELHNRMYSIYNYLKPNNMSSEFFAYVCDLLMFVFAPLFLFTCLEAHNSLKNYFISDPRASKIISIGFLVLFISAIGIDFLSNFATNRTHAIIQTSCEEVGEMCGQTIIIWGLWELMRTHRIKIIF